MNNIQKRFEVSFNNPVLRTWLIIMLPLFVVASLLLFLTDIPGVYITLTYTTGTWIVFFIWLTFYKIKTRKMNAKQVS